MQISLDNSVGLLADGEDTVKAVVVVNHLLHLGVVNWGIMVNSMVDRGSVVNSMAGHWSQAFCLLLVKTVFVLKHKKKIVDTNKDGDI